MIISITYIRLKSPWHFFSLANNARYILKQLKANKHCASHKQTGFWIHHYTMSKWISEDDMMLFVKSGAHLESMKISNQIAAKIIVKRLVQNDFPTWKEAKKYIHSSK